MEYLYNLKKETGLRIIDAHVHPFDVMGVVHYSDFDLKSSSKPYGPSFSDKNKFSKTSNIIQNFALKFLPRVAVKEIRELYINPDEKLAIKEMTDSLVDNLVFLSLDPWASAYEIKKVFYDNKFFLLGSLDIHKIKLDEIEAEINKQINELNIVGIKLHPNLQNFKPQPSHNSSAIGEKLEKIYQLAESKGLYLHFHGGKSSFTEYVHEKFAGYERSKNNAIISNFVNKDGSSEVIGKYNIPIIIAHLGHFGQSEIDFDSIKIIAKHDNIFFDTAAVSPRMIYNFLKVMGSDKIILGSDAFYNKISYAINFVYEASSHFDKREKDKHLVNILGNNYFQKICKQY